MTRPVSDCNREDLQDGLFEVINLIFNTLTLPDAHPDYTKQLVESILEKSHTIFKVNDIVDHLPVFSIQHALKIVELFNEIFQDIPNLDTMIEVFGQQDTHKHTISMPIELYNFDKSDDGDDLFTFDDDFLD